MLNRRRFLAHALRLPAAVAALPVLGGLVTLAQEAEPEAPLAESAGYDAATLPLADYAASPPTIGYLTATVNGVVHRVPLFG